MNNLEVGITKVRSQHKPVYCRRHPRLLASSLAADRLVADDGG
ncbi:hypothetical protein [Nostoc commune]|nr:hypothetical protein [Nostoc commune]